MLNQLVKLPPVLILLLLFYNHSLSQRLRPNSSSLRAYKNAIAFYNQSFREELHLFNGKEEQAYPYQFSEGTPYFLSNKWSKGTLDYDGKMYEDVSLLYDVVRDELIYLYFDNRSRIRLIKEKVSEFSIMGHNFINITPDSLFSSSIAPGFYDKLYQGKINLLVKRTKKIDNSIKLSGAETKVFDKDRYYLRKENNYYSVNNKRSLLHKLNDKRKELQPYIRQNKLNFRKDIENAMVKTLAYYDQLIKQK